MKRQSTENVLELDQGNETETCVAELCNKHLRVALVSMETPLLNDTPQKINGFYPEYALGIPGY